MSTDPNFDTTAEGNPRQRRRFNVPSTWIAEKTGYNRQGIYRMRMRGNRDKGPMPMERMERMEKAFGWSEADQFAAIREGRWIEEFERVVSEAYFDEKERPALRERRERAQAKNAAAREAARTKDGQ